MISFRFHVVSITAVFLALAIGVVVGSTYVDRAIVDNLQDRIDTVSANLDDRRDQAEALDAELGEARAFADASAPFAVTGRLEGTGVVIFALRGTDEDLVASTVELARRAGAGVPGAIWIEDRWVLGGDDDRSDLTAVTAVQGDRRQARTRAWAAVVDELVDQGVDPAEGTTTTIAPAGSAASATTAPTGPGTGVLAGLVREGFLTVDALGDPTVTLASLVGTGPRVLLLTGAGVDVQLEPLLNVVARAAVDGPLPTVVGDGAPGDDQEPRGSALSRLDETTRAGATVVDDVDLSEGRVAAVLALARPVPGAHYGYGPGAVAVLPGWTPR